MPQSSENQLASLLVVAAGTGSRMGSQQPKQFLDLLPGQCVLEVCLRNLLAAYPWAAVVVVGHPDWLPETLAVTQRMPTPIAVAAGGATRTASVQNGLVALAEMGAPASGWVAIHDGVRPIVTPRLVADTMLQAQAAGAAVAAVPVKSSLRELHPSGYSQPVERSRFFHVQTPQVFPLGQLLAVYQAAPPGDFTDDASLYQAAGYPVGLSQGDYNNLKITTPEDLLLARQLLKGLL
jgi:2-C-methyl-D-erythritol 4-phosphate cytidylyltransferase